VIVLLGLKISSKRLEDAQADECIKNVPKKSVHKMKNFFINNNYEVLVSLYTLF